MNITAQPPALSFNNWLTTSDFLSFAKMIWAPVCQSNLEAMERKVDDLYSAACKRYPTYETMVHNAFCAGMNAEFGTDEQADGVAEAFAYAREAYNYLSACENEAQRQDDANNGICCHGLDAMTCPCGCFEHEDYDNGDTESDNSKYFAMPIDDAEEDCQDEWDNPTSHANEADSDKRI